MDMDMDKGVHMDMGMDLYLRVRGLIREGDIPTMKRRCLSSYTGRYVME